MDNKKTKQTIEKLVDQDEMLPDVRLVEAAPEVGPE